MNELTKRLTNLLQQVQDLKSQLNLDQKEQRILELEDKMQVPNFWDDPEGSVRLPTSRANMLNTMTPATT